VVGDLGKTSVRRDFVVVLEDLLDLFLVCDVEEVPENLGP
jgi:hypothetical protein